MIFALRSPTRVSHRSLVRVHRLPVGVEREA